MVAGPPSAHAGGAPGSASGFGLGLGAPEGAGRALPLVDVDPTRSGPVPTGLDELDRVLGGGLVPGSVTGAIGYRAELACDGCCDWVETDLCSSRDQSASPCFTAADGAPR